VSCDSRPSLSGIKEERNMLRHEEDKNEAAKKTICCFKNSTLFLTDSGSSKRKATINYPNNTFPEAHCVFSENAAVEAPDDAVY